MENMVNNQKNNQPDNIKVVLDNEKKISNTKVVYLVLFLSIFGFVVLFASGTLSSPKVVQTVNQHNNDLHNNPHSGADLTSLNQIKELETHLENTPNDYKSLLSLAHLLNDNGFFSKAINKYKMYLEAFPKEADVWVDMGVCYFELKDFDNAIVNMEKAIAINPNHQIACLNLGIVNINANNTEKAKQWWEKAVNIDPNTDAGIKAKDLLNSNL